MRLSTDRNHKREPNGTLGVENTITEMKNSLDVLNSVFELAEGRITKLENSLTVII